MDPLAIVNNIEFEVRITMVDELSRIITQLLTREMKLESRFRLKIFLRSRLKVLLISKARLQKKVETLQRQKLRIIAWLFV